VAITLTVGTTPYYIASPATVADANWHHFAGVRNGNTLYLFLDGVSQGTRDVTGVTVNNSSQKMVIGRMGGYHQYTNGWIDEFRFSKGIARWTSNFTLPASEYIPGMTPTPTATFTPTLTPTRTYTPTATFTPANTATFTATPTPTNSQIYNRGSAVNYAETYVYSRNPDYPLSSNAGCDCNNCTNYLSQVLHNGGYPLRPDDYSGDASEWWYKPQDLSYSLTWSAADSLKWYVLTWATDFTMKPSVFDLQSGDFILLDLRENTPPYNPIPDGIPDHASFVIGYGYTSVNQVDYTDGCGGTYTIPQSIETMLINQNCVDRHHVAWDYRVNTNVHNLWYVHIAK
jgi:hypothetical protein